jgi:Zn-dependent M28 family amino/carboxypeptidase
MPSLPQAVLCAILLGVTASHCQIAKPRSAGLCIPCIQGDMTFLAADELHGRGSGTRDEHLAALYAASLFAGFGLEPGGDHGSFLQKAPLPNPLPPGVVGLLAGFAQVPRTETWNVVGVLRGSDPVAGKDAILLTAHLDHLGIGPVKKGDRIYNGADDDASGTTAVIELARVFAGGPRPARTLLFVLFGSEEIGGYGNRYFLDHPPVPLSRIVANLEFEMIGRPDPALPRDGLWLTGFERSDLGPELARHGASLVADPHPAQKFFQRSDNYSLARRGIVAQTVSSFGLHADYHEPSDEIARIDFPHMTRTIGSMVEPIEWLAQTTWKPRWRPGGRPSTP